MVNARADDGELYADLEIDTSNAAGEYADQNLKQTLESEGTKGFGGPSVEIDAEGQDVDWNEDKGVKELLSGYISGLGLVKNPASKPVHFARQTAERGVALSEAQTTYTLEKERKHMDTISDVDEARSTLDNYGFEGLDEMSDEDVMDMVEDLHDDLMVTDDDMGYGGEMADDMEEDEEEDEEDMDMMDDDMQEELANLRQRLEVLEDEMSTMSAMGEDLADAETVSELSESVETIRTELSDVQETTKELAEEPKEPKTLSDDGEPSGDDPGGRVTAISEKPSY
jgi:cob(I)alamin adenosyltransferase